MEIYNLDAENSMLNLRHVSQVTHIHMPIGFHPCFTLPLGTVSLSTDVLYFHLVTLVANSAIIEAWIETLGPPWSPLPACTSLVLPVSPCSTHGELVGLGLGCVDFSGAKPPTYHSLRCDTKKKT